MLTRALSQRPLARPPWPIAVLAVIVGQEAVRHLGRELSTLVPVPPADPVLWPVLPRLPLLAYAFVLALALGVERAGLRRPLFARRRWLPFVIVMLLPGLLALPVGGVRPPEDRDAVLLRTAIAGGAEEIIDRGIVLTLLLPLGLRSAALLSALLFAVGHLVDVSGVHPENRFIAFNAFGGGLLFAAMRVRSGSVYPGIVAHAAYNVLEMLRWYDTPLVRTIDVLWPLVVGAIALLALRPDGPAPRPPEPLVATVGSPFWHALRAQLGLPPDPTSSGGCADAQLHGPWRSDRHVVARMASTFPRRCIRCGRAAEGRASRVRLWVRRPMPGLLAFALRLFYLAPLFATRTHVSVFVCAGHRRRQALTRWAGVLGVVGAVACVAIALEQDPPSGILATAALVLLFAGFVAMYLARGPRLRGRRIIGSYVVMEGSGRGFRDTLPVFTRASETYAAPPALAER